MNKKVITGIVVLLILVVGGYGSYRVYKHFKRLAGTSSTPVVTESNPSGSNTVTNTIKDLIAKGTAESCTFTTDSTSGTIFIASGKVRGDFKSVVNGGATNSHMILNSNTVYMWIDGKGTGFKMAYDPTATPNPSGNTSGTVDINATMNYKCNPWVSDTLVFELPKTVNFMTFTLPTSAPAGSSGSPTTGSSSNCSYCNALSGSDKTQCLAALNCK